MSSAPDRVSVREIVTTVKTRWQLWAVPTVLCTLAATIYATVKTDKWSASQALVVRDEAGGSASRAGRFDSIDAMKTAQETILEVARNQAVVYAAIVQARSPKEPKLANWPTAEDVSELKSRIAVKAPSGAEFGKTEVIYLTVTANRRAEALRLTNAVCDQLEARLRELRSEKSLSLTDEIAKRVRVAESDLAAATKRLETMEAEIGSDLGELRVLNEAGLGESSLRSQQGSISNELRHARAAHEANVHRRELLRAARNDPNTLIATPNGLLESQPSLRRLKDGIVDAQLACAQLEGKMSPDHPQVKAAMAAEQEVRQHLRRELDVALRGVEADVQVSESLVNSLEAELRRVNERLDKLASIRARYGNLIAEVKRCSEVLENTNRELTDARARRMSAEAASLVTRLDGAVASDRPLGPSRSMIALGGMAAGFFTGLGWLFVVSPLGGTHGRRWTDLLRYGRRSSDRERRANERTIVAAAQGPVGRRSNEVSTITAASPAALTNAAADERRTGTDRRTIERRSN